MALQRIEISARKDIAAETRTYERGLSRRNHDFSQLVVSLSGEIEMFLQQEENRLGSDRTIFIPAHVEHEFETTQSGEFMVFDIPRNAMPNESTIKQPANVRAT